jgi:AcrR family transcriptional regulator
MPAIIGETTRRDAEQARARIVEASRAVLLEVGTGGWTVDAVARRAGCAKGLVHYHFGTKGALLLASAAQIAAARWRRIAAGLELRGPAAIDALWDSVLAAVRSGETRARFGLLALPGTSAAFAPPEVLLEELADRFQDAFDQDDIGLADAGLLLAALNGLEMLLLAGTDESAVREAYHRLLLYLVG